MIETFRHRGLRRLFEDGDRSGLRQDQVARIERILHRLDTVSSIEDMGLPGWRLHRLHGALQVHWAVSVNGNWRIVFRFEAGKARDVDLVDYH